MMCRALEQNGAKVYVVGIHKEAVEKMVKEESVCLLTRDTQTNDGHNVPVQQGVNNKCRSTATSFLCRPT